MVDFLKKIYGKERIEKEENLKNSLLLIEEKYIEYFKSRPPKFNGELHDHLHNHWVLWDDGITIKFGFDKTSDLPQRIQNECLDCFKTIFSK
jgi:hypothetical protein